MTKKDRLIGLFVCALFGFIGGVTSNLFFTSRRAAADQVLPVIKAQRFELVDSDGWTAGQWSVNGASGQPLLVMKRTESEMDTSRLELTERSITLGDKKQSRIILQSGTPERMDGPEMVPLIETRDSSGKTRWSTWGTH